MSTPIRRTTARLAAVGAMTLGSAGLLAGPVLAQYPPPPIDITVTTPGATIEVSGSAWEPGTVVTITRKRGNRAEAAATQDSQSSGTETTQATVQDDGTFTAPITVPEDAAGQEIQYEVSGVDEQGQERTEVQALNVQLTSAEMPAEDADLASPVAPAEDGDDYGWLLAVGGAVALAGGAAFTRRKVTDKS